MTKIQEMSNAELAYYLLWFRVQLSLDRTPILSDCSSSDSILGQVLTEIQLRKSLERDRRINEILE